MSVSKPNVARGPRARRASSEGRHRRPWVHPHRLDVRRGHLEGQDGGGALLPDGPEIVLVYDRRRIKAEVLGEGISKAALRRRGGGDDSRGTLGKRKPDLRRDLAGEARQRRGGNDLGLSGLLGSLLRFEGTPWGPYGFSGPLRGSLRASRRLRRPLGRSPGRACGSGGGGRGPNALGHDDHGLPAGGLGGSG